MTASPVPITAEKPADSTAAPDRAPELVVSARRDWATFAATLAGLLVIFLALQNPYWVPGGDSEVYTASARNLATGLGYTFNGQPVNMLPPGWSWVLAGLMLISPEFLFLKLATMSCMLGSLAMAYWICRRFASPALSAAAVLLTGILSYVYLLTIWLHSDALFCLFSSAAVLLAFQVNEGRRPGWGTAWRIAAICLFCIAVILVRFAGLLTWAFTFAVLVNGQLLPRLNARWIGAALAAVCTFASFATVRHALEVPEEIEEKIQEFGGTGEAVVEAIEVLPGPNATMATTYRWFNPASDGFVGYLARAGTWGNWFSFLVWQPFRLAASNRILSIPSILAGWCIIIPLLAMAWDTVRKLQWFWLAILMYSLALAMNWPQPNARYLVPLAPFIVLGVFLGMRSLGRKNWLGPITLIFTLVFLLNWNTFSARWMLMVKPLIVVAAGVGCYLLLDRLRRRTSAAVVATGHRIMLGAFVVSVLACNVSLWAVDVYIARADDYYGTYEAGLNRDLIRAGHWLIANQKPDERVAVAARYENLGRIRYSPLGLRITTMLTGQSLYTVPRKYTNSGDPRQHQSFLLWCRNRRIRYYLYQPPVSPWRVHHFRMGWLQEKLTGQAVVDTGAGWRLYYIPPEGPEAQRISLPPIRNWPTRVPGM